MEQLTLFRDEEAPIWKPPPQPRRLPTEKRAGTVLDHRWTQPIYGHRTKGEGQSKHGLLDTSQRVYQGGGEAGNFIYWKLRVVSLDIGVWEQIKDKADWIEMLDHSRNEVWRIAMARAIKEATVYDGGIGRRVGIPMGAWTVLNGEGNPVR